MQTPPVYKSNPHDEYELIQKIGSGTYGDVYRVRGRNKVKKVQPKIKKNLSIFRAKTSRRADTLQLK